MKKIIISIFIIIISLGTYSLAAENSYEIKMETEKTQYKQGESIKIPVEIENINMENGIIAYDTILEYDDSIFENVKILKAEKWSTPVLLENLIHSARADMEPSKEDQEIMIISLDVKKFATSGKTTIKLSQFDATDLENTVRKEEAAEIELEITEEEDADVILQQDINEDNSNTKLAVTLIIGVGTGIIITLLIIYYFDSKKKNKK